MTYLNENNNYDYDEDRDVYLMPEDPSAYAVAVFEETGNWIGEEGSTVVVLTPIEYFDATGYMWDQYMEVEEKMPDGFYQAMEATYETELSVEDAKAELARIGFNTEHEGFIAFMTEAHEAAEDY